VTNLRSRLLPFIDLLTFPFVYPSGWLLKNIRRVGVGRLPKCKNALMRIGVFPIRNHYYEPQFDHRQRKQPFSQERNLPGIDWNIEFQLKMLTELSFTHELTELQRDKAEPLYFSLNNRLFGSGDAEYWYQLIRLIKPEEYLKLAADTRL